jgi:hypothetical protein
MEDGGDGETQNLHREGRQDPLERPVLVDDQGAEGDDGHLAVSVEEGSGGGLEVPAGQVRPENVLKVISEDLDVVHVPKGGLSDVGHTEAS